MRKKLTILFALLCASMMSWAVSQDTYLGCDGGLEAYAKSIKWYSLDKVTAPNDVVSIQKPGWTGLVEGGIYVNVGQDYDGVKFDGVAVPVADYCYIQGTGGILYISKFVNKCTSVEFTKGEAVVRGMRIQNDKGTGDACATGSGGGSTPEPTAFSIKEVWPTDRVTATTSGDDILVHIASYGGGQWQGQVKLQHNVSFENTKTYKVGFTLTADKDCGGITFKTDDNQGEVYENQSINLTASTPYYYEKVFKGQAGNNKIMVFDFGLVGDNTNITISNLALVEYSPATASSTNGDLIPFLAVDGNTGTRWQAASTGEAWWRMDYGTSQSFNRVNITWENSYAKSFTIQGSNDDESYTTLATVSGQTISTFPYKQVIDLDQLYNYRYVKFVGTENGNGYGFSFYEFEIMEVETSVLTSVVITSPRRKTVCPISSSIDITAEARDQYDMPMGGQTITYSVSPASAGTIDANGHYTASQVGEATITASCSDKQASYVVVNTISANLALNKPATAGANETPIANANDADLNSLWALGPNRPVEEMWWRVDLEETYDLSLVIIKWDGACPTEHAIQVSSDDANWTDVATLSGWPVIGGNDDHNYQFYPINAQGRYIRVKASALRENGWGMKIFDFQAFGTVAASPTKSVSASVNDPAMGSASVTQNDAVVTEVTTGSTVTFSATPKDGYVFVNWSNGETRATFDAVVNSAMNLTANFRALNHISCNEEMTSGDYTAYVTYRKTANENEYEFIVRSAQTMTGFSNVNIGHINGDNQTNLNGQGELSGNGHKLSYTFTSTTEPKLNSPLYVNFAGHGEVTFNQINNFTVFEFSQPCADPEITAIELNKTEATLDMGNTLTLVPTFTPAYMSADITWETSDADVATVDNGVVTPVAPAPSSVTITAKVTEDIKATCAITVQNAASHNWYGYGTSQDLDYTYRIEYTTDHHIVAHVKRQGDKTGLVDASMLISGVWTDINNTEGEEEGWKKGTTAATFTAGDNILIRFQSNWAGPSSIIEFNYEVGSDNVMPTIVPSVLKLNTTEIRMGLSDANVQLTAEIHHRDAANQNIIWSSDDETVATVVNGLVHPVGVGSATITAKSQADENVSATCAVTIVGVVEPATFWGNGTSNGVAIAYSITRNSNHTLTYAVEALQDKEGFVVRINDGEYHNATLNEGIYTWTSEATYIDGAVFSGFIYMPFTGGDARVDFVNYEVGSELARRYIPITVTENADNSSVLVASDSKVREVTVTRSFTAGNLYTLVLPFNVDAAQTASQLPGQLTKLNNSYLKDNGDLRVNFVNVDAIEAGVPYLYKPSADVINPAFVGVTVSAALNPKVPADDYAKFYGIYAPKNGVELKAIKNAYVLGQDQYLYNVQDLPDAQEMKALRAYFVLNFPSAAPGAPKRLAKVVFNENETETTTDIEDLQTDNTCTKVIVNGQLQIIRDGRTYNAQGQLVK